LIGNVRRKINNMSLWSSSPGDAQISSPRALFHHLGPRRGKGCGLFVPPALREGNHMTEKTNVTISTVTTILFLGVLGAFLWFVVSGNKLAKPGVIVLALLLAAAVGVKIPSWVRYLQRKR